MLAKLPKEVLASLLAHCSGAELAVLATVGRVLSRVKLYRALAAGEKLSSLFARCLVLSNRHLVVSCNLCVVAAK